MGVDVAKRQYNDPVRLVAMLLLLACAGLGGQAPAAPLVYVGVVDDRPGDASLAEIRKLRFTIVARQDPPPGGRRLYRIPPAGSTAQPQQVAIEGLEVLRVDDRTRGATLRRDAWIALGRGLRVVLFDGWTALRRNAEALEAAAAFADVVTRNAALFGPLRPSSRAVRVAAATPDIFARFVESNDAIVLVAANLTDAEQRVTLTFGADTPEAIWQNMEHGGAVNFVAGPEGPLYTRVFPPHDVVVLMIRTQYR